MREHLELPRPLRLLRTATWSLTESAGLPIGAAALGAWLYGRDAGLVAGLVATWLTALIRKIATGSVPSLLTISAVVLTLQTEAYSDTVESITETDPKLKMPPPAATPMKNGLVGSLVPPSPPRARLPRITEPPVTRREP